jgi:endonuclease/exonuclease/phosphatase family metal-dependent hydrolase
VLHELNADVVALQECDRRFGARISALPRQALEEYHWQVAPVAVLPESIGWHGNALLVKRGITIRDASPISLPTVEPRGAACADLELEGRLLRVVGMHLDLSGLRRRHQIRSVLSWLDHQSDGPCPSVLMGDFNEWSRHGGALREFAHGWHLHEPGPSFPSRRPVARLDRIVTSDHWEVVVSGVHHSALSARASDHLPVLAKLRLRRD